MSDTRFPFVVSVMVFSQGPTSVGLTAMGRQGVDWSPKRSCSEPRGVSMFPAPESVAASRAGPNVPCHPLLPSRFPVKVKQAFHLAT